MTLYLTMHLMIASESTKESNDIDTGLPVNCNIDDGACRCSGFFTCAAICVQVTCLKVVLVDPILAVTCLVMPSSEMARDFLPSISTSGHRKAYTRQWTDSWPGSRKHLLLISESGKWLSVGVQRLDLYRVCTTPRSAQRLPLFRSHVVTCGSTLFQQRQKAFIRRMVAKH